MNHHEFDTVVVGSGTSAYYAVDGLNKAGLRVAIVDERPYGGTCALRGCQPKKYLVSNAEAVAMASHLVGRGIISRPKSDWQSLQDRKKVDAVASSSIVAFSDAKAEKIRTPQIVAATITDSNTKALLFVIIAIHLHLFFGLYLDGGDLRIFQN